MLVATELKSELARIRPARPCCRRAELAGLLYGHGDRNGVRTLDHATARTAVQLASALGIGATAPRPATAGSGSRRHHLEVTLDRLAADDPAALQSTCDRRAFVRGALLGSASISLGASGPHVEFVLRDRQRARRLHGLLAENDVAGGLMERRGRHVVYLKGQEQIAALLRLTGANRALLDFETGRVGREVRSRVNRLLNAEQANLGRTVRAADRQLQAIAHLDSTGELDRLSPGLREAAAERRAHPDADLDGLASSLGISRSAVNHRLRRLVELAGEITAPAATVGASR
ncbi:MAG TPA: DNA-binding protein WhiA [Candidatus Limnocylindria bacterium]|nr:DNA-binding protein WhiA [Candidatus Limnocylindrales bacterium]